MSKIGGKIRGKSNKNKNERKKHYYSSGIVIHGYKMNSDQEWKTSIIYRVINSNRFETRSGNQYELVGKCDLERSIIDGGIPKMMVTYFRDGIPSNLNEIIQRLLELRCTNEFFSKFFYDKV